MGSRLSAPANERPAISIGAREVNTERSPNEAQATSRVIRVAREQFINMKARDRSTGARAANSADDKIRAHETRRYSPMSPAARASLARVFMIT